MPENAVPLMSTRGSNSDSPHKLWCPAEIILFTATERQMLPLRPESVWEPSFIYKDNNNVLIKSPEEEGIVTTPAIQDSPVQIYEFPASRTEKLLEGRHDISPCFVICALKKERKKETPSSSEWPMVEPIKVLY